MKKLISAMIHDDRGTSAVEMGLICSLIVLAMLTALQNFASETQATWNHVSSATADAVSGSTAS